MAKQPTTTKEKEVFLSSKVNRKVEVKKDKRTLPNAENVVYKFKANVPKLVPRWFANYCLESYSHVFTLVDKAEAEKILATVQETPAQAQQEEADTPFNAKEFLNQATITKETLLAVGDKNLFKISAELQLPVELGTDTESHVEKILSELAAIQEG
jgi:hypothetical protein